MAQIFTTETGLTFSINTGVGPTGATGPAGTNGTPGADGSDAEVTAPNVIAAIAEDPAAVRAELGLNSTAMLILGDGQSNMVHPVNSVVTLTNPRVHVWSGSAWLDAGATSVGAMVINTANEIADRDLVDVYVVVSGTEGTAISGWMGSGTSSTQYTNAKTLVESAIASSDLTTLGKTSVDCIVWAQGENDAESETYITDWTTLWNQWDAETWFDKTMGKVIIPRVSANYATYWIYGAQGAIQNLSPYIAAVDSAGVDMDGGEIHFSAAGFVDWGRRLASVFYQIPHFSSSAPKVRTPAHDVFIGHSGGYATGTYQTCIGEEAGRSNTGTQLIAIGENSARSNTGGHLYAMGYGAGQFNTGIRVVAHGYNAGLYNKGDDSVFIGYLAGPQTSGNGTTYDFNNVVGLGKGAQPLKANQIMLGGATHTSLRTYATQITTGIIASYADDAAADADTTLPSGSFYKTTAGGRALYQKP